MTGTKEMGSDISGGERGYSSMTSPDKRRTSVGANDWDGMLSAKGEEFAMHIGIDLEDSDDKKHAWIAERAVSESMPEGWSQHEDEEGMLIVFFCYLCHVLMFR